MPTKRRTTERQELRLLLKTTCAAWRDGEFALVRPATEAP